MDTASLRSPIVRSAIESLNAGKLDDFMAVFASDAIVVDEATYRGQKEIRDWAVRENFNVRMHIDVVKEKDVHGLELEIQATSHGGYNGPGTFSFAMQGNLVKHLEIG